MFTTSWPLERALAQSVPRSTDSRPGKGGSIDEGRVRGPQSGSLDRVALNTFGLEPTRFLPSKSATRYDSSAVARIASKAATTDVS
jgi:hypothetical protein